MMVAMISSVRQAARLASILGLLLACLALLLLALAPGGWRAGWWAYRVSLLTLMPLAAYFGLAAAAVSVLALVLGRSALRARWAAAALLAILIGGGVAYVPWHYRSLARSVPRIDDITTDTQNPPAFAAVLAARAAEHGNLAQYAGAKLAALQRQGYPDLAPLTLPLAPEKAFALALATARGMGWTIVAAEPSTGRIEATQRSLWMGFTDDIVVRISKTGEDSRIDMRSASRHGRSDLGVNAARIRAYFAKLRAATAAN